MLRHLGLIAVYACIVASVGCDGGTMVAPAPSPSSAVTSPSVPTVTVAFSGRVVNAEAGNPVGNVRVWLSVLGVSGSLHSWVSPTEDSTTSGGDGTFTLSLDLPRNWSSVHLRSTGNGYDDGGWSFQPNTAGNRVEIQMYPTLVIRPGESIEVRVEPTVNGCAFAGVIPCRRVLVEASPGGPVQLEIVPHDTSKPMGLAADIWAEESVLRLTVAPGADAYVHGVGSARLTARR